MKWLHNKCVITGMNGNIVEPLGKSLMIEKIKSRANVPQGKAKGHMIGWLPSISLLLEVQNYFGLYSFR